MFFLFKDSFLLGWFFTRTQACTAYHCSPEQPATVRAQHCKCHTRVGHNLHRLHTGALNCNDAVELIYSGYFYASTAETLYYAVQLALCDHCHLTALINATLEFAKTSKCPAFSKIFTFCYNQTTPGFEPASESDPGNALGGPEVCKLSSFLQQTWGRPFCNVYNQERGKIWRREERSGSCFQKERSVRKCPDGRGLKHHGDDKMTEQMSHIMRQIHMCPYSQCWRQFSFAATISRHR